MLFTWHDATGKRWGFWVGIEKPGRLPGKSRQGKNERIGAQPPRDELQKFLGFFHAEEPGIQKLPNGNKELLGFGSGLGVGSGSGWTNTSDPPAFPNKNPEPEDNGREAFDHSVGLFPANRRSYSANTQTLYFQAIGEMREHGSSDAEAVAKMDRAITAYVAKEGEFCFGFERFLRDGAWKGYLASISSNDTPSLAAQDAENQRRLKAVSGMTDEEYGKHRQEILRRRRGE